MLVEFLAFRRVSGFEHFFGLTVSRVRSELHPLSFWLSYTNFFFLFSSSFLFLSELLLKEIFSVVYAFSSTIVASFFLLLIESKL